MHKSATRREDGERAATATKETSRLISSPRFNYFATWVTPTPGHVSMISCKVYGSAGRSVDKFTGEGGERRPSGGGDSAGKRIRGGIIESRRKIDSETGCWSSLQMLARTGPRLHFADSPPRAAFPRIDRELHQRRLRAVLSVIPLYYPRCNDHTTVYR